MGKIEELLGFDESEIKQRTQVLRETLPTEPGLEFLKTIAKRFEVQPWPFISYLAYNDPDTLRRELGCYQDYDGAENRQAILEGLREHYIIGRLMLELTTENG